LKKPPYKAYRKKKKEEELPVHIPEKIDTPQAEQLVSDFYRLLDFISTHKNKLLGALAVLLIIGGSYFGYRLYQKNLELKAAQLVDKGLYYLDRGEKKKAVELFEEAVKKYPNAPSGRLAAFLAGKLEKKAAYLERLAPAGSFLLSPPSKTTLITWGIDSGNPPSYQVKREEWTHPEYLYDQLLISLKRGDRAGAKNALDALAGDYPDLPITSLAQRLLK
jgi:outer membrane protein assembly factor BamD (BamD/ComL family)